MEETQKPAIIKPKIANNKELLEAINIEPTKDPITEKTKKL